MLGLSRKFGDVVIIIRNTDNAYALAVHKGKYGLAVEPNGIKRKFYENHPTTVFDGEVVVHGVYETKPQYYSETVKRFGIDAPRAKYAILRPEILQQDIQTGKRPGSVFEPMLLAAKALSERVKGA